MAVTRGGMTLADAIVSAQQGHPKYAKRQMTWFRHEPEVHWLNGFGDESGASKRPCGSSRGVFLWRDKRLTILQERLRWRSHSVNLVADSSDCASVDHQEDFAAVIGHDEVICEGRVSGCDFN
jgi:hypothetical protein